MYFKICAYPLLLYLLCFTIEMTYYAIVAIVSPLLSPAILLKYYLTLTGR